MFLKVTAAGELRLGYFANVTHATAVVGVAHGDEVLGLGHAQIGVLQPAGLEGHVGERGVGEIPANADTTTRRGAASFSART